MTTGPVVSLGEGALTVEVRPGQPDALTFTPAPDAAPLVPSEWSLTGGGPLTPVLLAAVADGDGFRVAWTAAQATALVGGGTALLRRHGKARAQLEIVEPEGTADPSADPAALTVAAGDVVELHVAVAGDGGGGVTDHRALSHRDEPGQHPIGAVDGLEDALAGLVGDGDPRLTDARTPTAHTHTQSDVTGLAATLAGKEAAGTAAGLIAALVPADIGAVADDDERLDDARTPTAHTHPLTDVVDLDDALEAKADLVDGLIPTSQLPALATVEVYTVEDEDEMLALVCQRGDVAIRLDQQQAYILAGDDPSSLGDWTVLPSPSAPVTSVNSQIGTVVLGYSDVGAAAATHSHTSGQVSGLATVATTGAYSDLSGRPTIPSTAAAVGAVAAGAGVATITAVTQDDYDLLTPASTTLYVIVED